MIEINIVQVLKGFMPFNAKISLIEQPLLRYRALIDQKSQNGFKAKNSNMQKFAYFKL